MVSILSTFSLWLMLLPGWLGGLFIKVSGSLFELTSSRVTLSFPEPLEEGTQLLGVNSQARMSNPERSCCHEELQQGTDLWSVVAECRGVGRET